MRRFLSQACLAGSLIFCFAAKTVQAQNSHKTATQAMHTQGSNAASRKLPCSYFETLPADIYKFIDKVIKTRSELGQDFGLTFPADIKQWRGEDFLAIATNQKSLGIALDFADIADAAYELTSDGSSYTRNAICVQRIMYHLKPDCCPTLDDFYTMIARNCRRSFIKRQMQEHR